MAVSDSTAAARRYARALRRPHPQDWFGWYDPRSWAVAVAVRNQLHPSVADARRAAEVLRRGRRHGRMLASLPRAGTNWLQAMLNSAHDLELGGTGGYEYVPGFKISGDPSWIPAGQRLCWSAPTASLVQLAQEERGRELLEAPVLCSHHPMSRGPLKTDREPGRPVVLVRHPKVAMRSAVRKLGYVDLATHRRAARTTAEQHVEWFDTWAAALARPDGDRILVVRYEDLMADTPGTLQAIAGHWDLHLGDDAAARAIEICSRGAMEAKTGHDPSNVRVTVGEPKRLDPELVAFMDSILDDQMHDALGYDLGAVPDR